MKTNHTRDEDRLQSKPLDAETVYWWITHANSKEEATDWLTTTLTQLVKEVEAGAYEEALKLSDEIEIAEPDGGTRQWMAFKRFRNTLRDRLTPPTSDVTEK